MGKGRQNCKAEIEKHNLVDMTVEEALPYVTKMCDWGDDLRIRLCELHTESKKPYEIELGVVSDATQHRFVRVEAEKKKQLIANALQAIQDAANGDQMDVE